MIATLAAVLLLAAPPEKRTVFPFIDVFALPRFATDPVSRRCIASVCTPAPLISPDAAVRSARRIETDGSAFRKAAARTANACGITIDSLDPAGMRWTPHATAEQREVSDPMLTRPLAYRAKCRSSAAFRSRS